MKKIFLYISFKLLFVNSLFAQTIQEDKIKNPNFHEIRNTFYENYNAENEEQTEEGIGDGTFQKFKRWEWYWEQRVNEKGEFPKPFFLRDEWQKYLSANSKVNSKKLRSSVNWIPMGPFTSQGGVEGLGRLNCIAFHPTDSSTYWVGSPDGGLWKTSDNANTWTSITDNLPTIGVSDIAIDPTNSNIMYIATGDGERCGLNYQSTSTGVLKSIDGGNAWNITGLTFPLGYVTIRRLIINPNNPQILLAVSTLGIYRSTDGGISWSNQQIGFFIDIEFKPNDPNIIYASTYDFNGGTAQIYKSADGGLSWAQVTSFAGIGRIKIGVSAINPDQVDALCAKGWPAGGLDGIYRSYDSGNSFTQILIGNCIDNNMLTTTTGGYGCNAQGWYCLSYAINPFNANEIWVGGANTWRSIDGGVTWNINTTLWSSTTIASVHADKHFFSYNPLTPNKFYSCTDGGLYITYNGGEAWQDKSNGLQISQMYRLGTSQIDTNNVICGLQDCGTKELKNNAWLERNNPVDGMECLMDYSDPNIAYYCFQQGGIYRTTDSWTTSTAISTNILGNWYGDGAWVTPFIINPIIPSTLYVGYKKVFKTNDRGDTWAAISPNLTTSDFLRTVAIAPSDTNIIYAASLDSLFVTIDGGLTWNFRSQGFANARSTYFAIHPNNPQTLWMTYMNYNAGQKVYMSMDAGITWTNVSGTLPNVVINCIVYQNGSNDGLYIGTDVGVFYRDASMSDWIPLNSGLPNVDVAELEISYNNNKIWAATYGRGLWQSDLFSSTTNINENQTNISNFNISPNPTNGEIKIRNFIDQNIKYNIIVTNILGQKLFEIINNNSDEITININELNSGIYFLSLVTNKKTVVRKIILSK